MSCNKCNENGKIRLLNKMVTCPCQDDHNEENNDDEGADILSILEKDLETFHSIDFDYIGDPSRSSFIKVNLGRRKFTIPCVKNLHIKIMKMSDISYDFILKCQQSMQYKSNLNEKQVSKLVKVLQKREDFKMFETKETLKLKQ